MTAGSLRMWRSIRALGVVIGLGGGSVAVMAAQLTDQFLSEDVLVAASRAEAQQHEVERTRVVLPPEPITPQGVAASGEVLPVVVGDSLATVGGMWQWIGRIAIPLMILGMAALLLFHPRVLG